MKNSKIKTKSFFKITVILMIANLIAKVIGMLREVFLAKYYGASMYTDAYIIANNIPIIIFGVVGVALASSYIPLYSEIDKKKSKKEAIKFTNNVMSLLLVGCFIITIFGEIFTKQFINIFAMGFEGETLNFAIQFTRILMPCIFVMALMNISGSYLQVNDDFTVIGYVSIPSNIIIVISTILSYKLGNIYILVIGTTIGTFSQLVYYYPFLKRNGFEFKLNLNVKNRYIKKMGIMLIPVFIGESVNEINKIVDKTLVSGLDYGSVSSLNYADKLVGLFTGIFVISITTLVYPKLSKLIAENKNIEFNKLFKKVINNIIILVVPIIGIILVIAPFIVKLVFQRGTFDNNDTIMTYQALNCYAIGLIGISLRDILIKIFYSLKDTKTPMINGIICSVMNIPLSIILIKAIGHKGAALATSIVAIISVLRLMYKVSTKIKNITFKDTLLILIKAIVAILLPLEGLKIIYSIIICNSMNIIIQLITIMFSVFIVGGMYVGILLLLRCKEIKDMIWLIKKR